MKHVSLARALACILFTISNVLYAYKAMVVVPVADLLGDRIATYYPEYTTYHAYHKIPLCGATKYRWDACPRIHQVVFQEIVEVLHTKGNEAHIRIPHAFYVIGDGNAQQTTYWTLADNLVPLSDLEKNNIDIRTLPPMPDFNATTNSNKAISALIAPYYDNVTGLHLSAGTRFVRAKQRKPKTHVTVYVYHPHKKNICTINIPKKFCIACDARCSRAQKRKQFVDIARQWAHMNKGSVPYVWGGCSVVHTHANTFAEHTRNHNNKTVSFFAYTRPNKKAIQTGIDCAGLIFRAAQTAGIPYFYKNTHTIARYMPPLKEGQTLQIGDLIWTPGHIMLVADLDKNTMIEARSYFSGYGKVHEIPLNQVFKDMHTYNDLESAFFNKKPLYRLNSDGKVYSTLPTFKLLSLDCVLT